MAIFRITTQDATGTGTTSATATYAATPRKGNLLIAVVRDDFGSFTLPAGWIQAVSSGAARVGAVYYKIAGASEPTVITLSDASASTSAIAIYEYTGFSGVAQPDKTATASGTGTTTNPTGTTATTAAANELLIAYTTLAGTNTATVAASFTLRNSITGLLAVADQIVAATSTYSASFTTGAVLSVSDGLGIVTFLGDTRFTIRNRGLRPHPFSPGLAR